MHELLPIVTELEPLARDVLGDALQASPHRRDHDRLASRVPALRVIQAVPPPGKPQACPAHLRVAAWNAERLKHVEASAALLDRIGADVALLSEADIGMARSGNRHTVADLAALRGSGFVYGVEFAELGLGDRRERRWHAGEVNLAGFHGNAILSRFALADPLLVRLDDGARWFVGSGAADQRRLGGRMAMAARIAQAAAPLWVVVVHVESRSDPALRAAQVKRLLAALDATIGEADCVIGGDFNTLALPRGERIPAGALLNPDTMEPLFRDMAEAGFGWTAANTDDVTSRTRPDGAPLPPFTRIDWLFVRGLVSRNPLTVPAVDHHGIAISDHDLIAVDIGPC